MLNPHFEPHFSEVSEVEKGFSHPVLQAIPMAFSTQNLVQD
jgi:hypothetical protein